MTQDNIDPRRPACDLIIERAVEMMLREVGAPPEMMIDRLLTYAAAAACMREGSQATASAFDQMAENIRAGALHSVTGEGAQH